jgi:lambda family phage holin
MKNNKGSKMLDKIQPEAIQGGLSFLLSFVMSFLNSFQDNRGMNWKADILEALTCGFLGLAFFTLVYAIGWNIYFSFFIATIIGHVGSKKSKQIVLKIVKDKLN